ncbi:MAG: glucose-6-phosphate isomerase [Candidatus Limnocylindrales bacterium]
MTDALRLPAGLEGPVAAAIARAVGERWAERLWARDTSLWTTDPEVAATIADRLGWLDAPLQFSERTDELAAFARGVVDEGFERALVCGLGGSSLAPEVLAMSYPRSAHGLPVGVLDSTDPEAVQAATDASDPARTLYLIATKSGTTTETLSFLAHFWDLEHQLHGHGPESAPGEHFVAITDPGNLEAIDHTEAFRGVYLNPHDVGGRYSALTYVGLVPAAILGLDLDGLLGDARQMADRCTAPDSNNPGVWLGAVLGALAMEGRDKLTFIIEPSLASLGAWLEQLVAESTGKHGVGIVPVDGEALGEPGVYGDDRVFVRLGRETAPEDWWVRTGAALDVLSAAGHPVIDLPLVDGEWLGGEFFRWEFATAIAGAVLGIDPFDEPNVTESKENTKRVLAESHASGALPAAASVGIDDALSVALRDHVDATVPSGYVAIQAYFAATRDRDATLRAVQRAIRDRTRHATTLGYGPRYLHSTGQLHKGGPPQGRFVQLVAGHAEDLAIPGGDETFGTLIDAQALGDVASLEAHHLPVLRIHLGDHPDAGLERLMTIVSGL